MLSPREPSTFQSHMSTQSPDMLMSSSHGSGSSDMNEDQERSPLSNIDVAAKMHRHAACKWLICDGYDRIHSHSYRNYITFCDMVLNV